MRGIEYYGTKDQIEVMDLHYSSDPRKDMTTESGQRWYRHQRPGYPGGMKGAKWQQEMELNFGIRAGKLVWADFMDALPIITCEPFDIPNHWPIWCGYDYGLENPFAWTAIAFESEDRFYKIDEIIESGLTVHRQAELIKRRPYYDRIRGIIGDPSIWNITQHKDAQTLVSIGDLFVDEGVFISRGRNEPGVDMAYINMLNGSLWQDGRENWLEEPKFIIFETCTGTLECYSRVRKQENRTPLARETKDEPESIISKGVDPFDADKYVLLAQVNENPEEVSEYAPGTWGYEEELMDQLEQQKENVLI